MNCKVGFTGTQEGMSEFQKKSLFRFFSENVCEEFHHGDCVGADSDAHDIARALGLAIHIHPPYNPAKRKRCVGGIIYPEKPYLGRNHDIVDACDVLIAAPKGGEVLRSGTW